MLICHAIISLRLASCGLPPLTHDGTSQHKGEYTSPLKSSLSCCGIGKKEKVEAYINVGEESITCDSDSSKLYCNEYDML